MIRRRTFLSIGSAAMMALGGCLTHGGGDVVVQTEETESTTTQLVDDEGDGSGSASCDTDLQREDGHFDGGSYAIEAPNCAETAGQGKVLDDIKIRVSINQATEMYGAFHVYVNDRLVESFSLSPGENSFATGIFKRDDPGEHRFDVEIRFKNSDTGRNELLAQETVTVRVVEDI